jgi:hypothetical protein
VETETLMARTLADRSERVQTVKIYLDHPTPGYTAEQGKCETDKEKGRIGCDAPITFYRTFPNEKRMPFDGPPVIVKQHSPRDDGAVIAEVQTNNVHFATCRAKARGNEVRR